MIKCVAICKKDRGNFQVDFEGNDYHDVSIKFMKWCGENDIIWGSLLRESNGTAICRYDDFLDKNLDNK